MLQASRGEVGAGGRVGVSGVLGEEAGCRREKVKSGLACLMRKCEPHALRCLLSLRCSQGHALPGHMPLRSLCRWARSWLPNCRSLQRCAPRRVSTPPSRQRGMRQAQPQVQRAARERWWLLGRWRFPASILPSLSGGSRGTRARRSSARWASRERRAVQLVLCAKEAGATGNTCARTARRPIRSDGNIWRATSLSCHIPYASHSPKKAALHLPCTTRPSPVRTTSGLLRTP